MIAYWIILGCFVLYTFVDFFCWDIEREYKKDIERFIKERKKQSSRGGE